MENWRELGSTEYYISNTGKILNGKKEKLLNKQQ